MSSPTPMLALGIDLGGTHLRAGVVNDKGEVQRAVRYVLQERDPASALALIRRAHQELEINDAKLPLGLGVAGQVELRQGVVVVAPNLAWRNEPIAARLHQTFAVPVRVINDLNAIAIAESHIGAGKGAEDVVCIYMGTGVGMGAVVHGQVLEGCDGFAAELGHVKVIQTPESGRQCGCGERGCLEAYAGGRHLPQLLTETMHRVGKTSWWNTLSPSSQQQITAREIEAAALEHDAIALALWDDIANKCAWAVGNMLTLLTPKVLIFGGGVIHAAPLLKQHLLSRLPRFVAQAAWRNLEIKEPVLGDSGGFIGAGLAALSHLTQQT